MSSTKSKFGFETTADDVVNVLGSHAKGRSFIVTGPSPGGLGEETVMALARAGAARLILVGRTPAKYAAVADAARSLSDGTDVRVYGVDLSSLVSIRSGAETILAENDRIDVLINNAAVSGLVEKQYSPEGIEMMFATNHLGPFLLTNLLMPALMRSDAPRVVTLSSGAYAIATGDYDDYNVDMKEYDWHQVYAESKLANIHFMKYMAKTFGSSGVVALSLHPGTIWGTSLVQALPTDEMASLRRFVEDRKVVPKTLAQGAATTLFAALDPTAKEYNGAYLADCQVQQLTGEPGNRDELAEMLWKLSERLVGQVFVN